MFPVNIGICFKNVNILFPYSSTFLTVSVFRLSQIIHILSLSINVAELMALAHSLESFSYL